MMYAIGKNSVSSQSNFNRKVLAWWERVALLFGLVELLRVRSSKFP